MTGIATIRADVRHRFKASPERVFDAFFDPGAVKYWLLTVNEETGLKAVHIDFRVGGQYVLIDERGGRDVVSTGAFYEIARPSRLEFSVYSPDYSAVTVRVTVDIVAEGTSSELHLVSEIGEDQLHLAEQLSEGWREMLALLDQRIGA